MDVHGAAAAGRRGDPGIPIRSAADAAGLPARRPLIRALHREARKATARRWGNYLEEGFARLVLAGVVESREERAGYLAWQAGSPRPDLTGRGCHRTPPRP
ncbi:hypothetical protein GCM10010404_57120 [Nonomuraea africana]